MRTTLASLVVAVGISTSVFAAPTVRLSIHDGRVDLSATGASIQEILNEWARVGGTRVVNSERLPASMLTLQLDQVPEAQALDILLRSAAGFIAVPRQVADGSASRFERLLILPTSSTPAAPAHAAAQPAPFGAQPPPFAAAPPVRVLPSGATPVLGPDGRPVADDQDGAPEPATPTPVNSMPPGFSPPSPNPAQAGAPAATPAPAAAPTAVGGSAVPGAIIRQQPPRPPRPGGGN